MGLFRFAVSAASEIEAPPDRVWEILVDLPGYPAWNPFTSRVDSTLEPGAPVRMQVRMGPRRTIDQTEYVSRHEEGTRICWGFQGALLSAERCQVVEPLGDARSRYSTVDVIHGPLAPIVRLVFAKPMQEGFDGVASALKRRAEEAARPPGREP